MEVLKLLLPLLLVALLPYTTAEPPDKLLCLPTNWDYAWSKVGNVWFARTHERGEWYSMAELCQNIEPGRSSIASVRSPEEQAHIVKGLPDEAWWLGGIRLGGHKWYWTSMKKYKIMFTPLTYKNWHAGEPSTPKFDHCLHMHTAGLGRKWNDISCIHRFRAICEIRCPDRNMRPPMKKK